MPQPKVAIDYQACDPSLCQDGVCSSALVCERKMLRQEEPGELPDIYPSLCLGCAECLLVCPKKALLIMS
jgi:NAD-dependent dihydropyrimidine dehydrogenase PreA subunit